MNKLILEGTHIIKGTILLETGMHIGGSKSSLDIGGLDAPVIKNPHGVPYIPGSSLKGKVRSLLGLKEGSDDVEKDSELLKKMFGYQGKTEDNKNTGYITRLIFRDAHLDEDEFEKDFPEHIAVLDTDYTVAKWENVIDRALGSTKTGGLRQIERVPAGAKFKFEIIINLFNQDDQEEIKYTLKEGLKLLENNYLGGSGTRGYGKVKIIYDKE